MTRSEILQIAKPILFNTEMVRVILDGRKTETRRVVKSQHLRVLDSPYHKEHPEVSDKVLLKKLCEPPYKPCDYLYVRETWAPMYPDDVSEKVVGYMYKADGGRMTVEDYDRLFPNGKKWTWPGIWRPSIHMPKEAARIFLRVMKVKVERLQDITEEQAEREGCSDYASTANGFFYIWDSTVKKSDIDRYGWDANPWVWVIEFEKMEVG